MATLIEMSSPLKTSAARGDRRLQNAPHILSYSGDLRFVELLGRSNFSFLQGASHPHEMVETALSYGYAGLGLCDVNGLYGVVRGHRAAYRPSHFEAKIYASSFEEFKYIVGSEIQIQDLNIALIPMNKKGYENLSLLLTQGKVSAPKNYLRLELRDILQRSDNLLAFPLPPWNLSTLRQLQSAFQDRLYLPVWKDMTWESLQFYKQALQLEEQGFELVATQRPLMHTKERKPLFDVLTCLLHKTTLEKAHTLLKSNSEFYLRPLQQLKFLWTERPDLLRKTLEIASRIQFSLTELRYTYPKDHLPPGVSATEHLRALVEQGLKVRYPQGVPQKVQELVHKELQLIAELCYEDYFLTLWEICEFARKRDILFQGRGSAANSVVCYALGLTNVNPTEIDLLFERFLSKERGEPPDIDIDFEHERREEVIQYIYKRYGLERTAMVNTVITYRSRLALREVAKVMGVPSTKIEDLVKTMGRRGVSHLLENPELMQGFGLSADKLQRLLEIGMELQGFPRHLGIHTGGFVISATPLNQIVPIEKSTMEGRYVIQWNKDDIDTLGLMKIDVLALGMLTALRKALQLLKEHKGMNLGLHQIPQGDSPTYAMIQKAETVGVFQIESRAQMSLLPRLKPKCFYDLVISVAIVRPGPLQGGMVHPFLKRRQGLEKARYAHPKLEPILKKTHGVPIFQEQIMQVAVAVADFSPGEADELRRIMSSSWRSNTLMEGLRRRLLSGMMQNGLALEDAEQIFNTIQGFASYGFPESHAASFALLTYASCYLKCHHPEVFLCALLNSQPMGFYAPRTLILEAQKNGVRVFPLDINLSQEDYTLEEHTPRSWAVRVGFRALYNFPKAALQKITSCRQQGPFKSLEDFVARTELSPRHLSQLALSGAFSRFGISPRQALWSLSAVPKKKDLFTHQLEALELRAPALPQESGWEALQRQYQSFGYSVETHPLKLLRPALLRSNTLMAPQGRPLFVHSEELARTPHGRRVKVAGLMSLLQRPPTAKGVCFVTLEDEAGGIALILSAETYKKYRLTLADHDLIWAEGPVQNVSGVLHVRAQVIGALPLERMLQSSIPP